MKNKLPRKRKKRMIKTEGILSYISAQVVNDIEFEEKGVSEFRFPKININFRNLKGYDIIGYW